jgi:hypothetical protein
MSNYDEMANATPGVAKFAEQELPAPSRDDQLMPASAHPHHGLHVRQDTTNELLAYILRELREMRKDMTSSFDRLSGDVSSVVTAVQTAIDTLNSWKTSSGNSDAPTDDQLDALSTQLESSLANLGSAETADAPPAVQTGTGTPTTATPAPTDGTDAGTAPDNTVTSTPGPAPTGFDDLSGSATPSS